MFSFFRKSILSSGLLSGMTDVHSHLLPGVDDGAKNIRETQLLLEKMEKVGVKHLYLTPHIMELYPNNRKDFLQTCFQQLLAELPTFSIQLRLAAEYMLDPSFRERKEEGLLTLGKNKVLVETSYLTPPLGLENMLFDLLAEGYIPVLAHPERYAYMDEDYYRFLHERGIYFQLNLSSLAGGYGSVPYRKACDLLKKGFYHLVGSDCHRLHSYQYMLDHLRLTKAQVAALSVLTARNRELFLE